VHSDGNRTFLTDQHHEALATRDSRVEQVPLQHGVVLGQDRDDDRGVFGPLALVDCRSIGGNQRDELAKAISDGTAVEAGIQFARVGIDVVDVADITRSIRPARTSSADESERGGSRLVTEPPTPAPSVIP
jgi:hypothetical protein